MPNEDWTGAALYVVPDDSVLPKKIQEAYPYYDFVLDDGGNLMDIVEIPRTPPEMILQAQLREQAYETMTIKSDGTDLILWEGRSITVDQANKVYLEYFAEGSAKATEIQALIVAAKTYIRELYPDE
jgi:hypothetical protein